MALQVTDPIEGKGLILPCFASMDLDLEKNIGTPEAMPKFSPPGDQKVETKVQGLSEGVGE